MPHFYRLMWGLTMIREYPNGDRSIMTNSSKKPPDSTPTRLIQWDSSWPELSEKNERHRLFSDLETRFGIPETFFDDYLLFKRKKSWSILKSGPRGIPAASLKVSKVGVKAFQKVGVFVKPTTRMIQTFGHMATKAKLEINEEDLQRLLNEEDLPMTLALDKGYVILSLGKEMILGLGFYGHGKVMSQLPQKELRKAMLASYHSFD